MKQFIETPNLILREWSEIDIPEFARLNSDEKVMEYFLNKLSFQQTIEFYNRIQQEFKSFGFGLYAMELKQQNSFMGYVGLHNVSFFDINFAPTIEIGWRILPEFWGKGYATEAAKACLKYAQNELNLKDICSFTALINKKSEHIMQKIGMKRLKEFDHPLIDPNHRLCRHILYTIKFQ